MVTEKGRKTEREAASGQSREKSCMSDRVPLAFGCGS